MSWNYRVMKQEDTDGNVTFGIYEVYYSEDGIVKYYTEKSMVPVVDNLDGLKYEMETILKAFELEILTYDEK